MRVLVRLKDSEILDEQINDWKIKDEMLNFYDTDENDDITFDFYIPLVNILWCRFDFQG
jgi:hypothetical protein